VACGLFPSGRAPAPVTVAPLARLPVSRPSGREVPMSAPAPRPKALLVVEGNEVEREGLLVVLAREGYALGQAAAGPEALSWLRDGLARDLIVLGLGAAALEGWALLQELQRLGPPAPVVVLGDAGLGRDWAAGHGCAGLVRKPVLTEELLAEVRRCLGKDP